MKNSFTFYVLFKTDVLLLLSSSNAWKNNEAITFLLTIQIGVTIAHYTSYVNKKAHVHDDFLDFMVTEPIQNQIW